MQQLQLETDFSFPVFFWHNAIEFAGLHIDPRVIGQKNSLIQGEHIRRKNGCIVNTGAKLSREEIRRRVAENKEQYELTEEEWTMIELPLPEDVSLQ